MDNNMSSWILSFCCLYGIFRPKHKNIYVDKKILKQLITINNDDIPDFTLNNIETIGKIVDVYDGDTCRIVFSINDKLVKYICRLYGLDAPEMKPLLKNENRNYEIKHAYLARNRLIQLSTNCNCDINNTDNKKTIKELLKKNTKLIYIKLFQFDKYGRVLVQLYDHQKFENKSYNEILLDEKYVVPYDGGTKTEFNIDMHN